MSQQLDPDPPSLSAKARRLASRLRLGPKARLGISIILLGLLLSQIDFRAALDVLGGAQLWPILACVLLIVAGRFLVAYRWYLLVRAARSDVSLGALLRLVFVSGFLGFWTPGGVGPEVLRIYGLARGTTLALAVSSVLIERLTALCALSALALLGLALAPMDLPQGLSLSAGTVFVLVTIAFVALFIPLLRRPLLGMLGSRKLTPLRERLEAIFHQIDHYRTRRTVLVWVVLLSVALQNVRILEKIVLAPALGIDIHFMYFFVLVPISLFVTLLPISVQGLGVREGVYVLLLGAVGVDSAAALMLSLLGFLLQTAVAIVPGALLYARGGLALSKSPALRPKAPS